FMKLGIAPEAVLAAYRVGDSPPNVITPLMPYFALIVTFARRYDKYAGVGTIIAMMLPYGVAVSVVWILLFLGWELFGLPYGPGKGVPYTGGGRGWGEGPHPVRWSAARHGAAASANPPALYRSASYGSAFVLRISI